MSGPIPAELGQLTNLESLSLDSNQLSGPIPAELGKLTNVRELTLDGNPELSGPLPDTFLALASLTRLWLADTGVCVPAGPRFAAWLAEIAETDVSRCAPPPAPVDDRPTLEAIYHATDGPNWLRNDGWLTSMPLEEWQGVNLDESGRVAQLSLDGNQLSGPIPAELDQLTNLELLYLNGNQLSGPIPGELGQLTNLETLWLDGNQLSGPIPGELGQLTNLRRLLLGDNQLSGPIPAELGQLTNLELLYLNGNQLSGPIPGALGQLTNLELLYLDGNQLSGRSPRNSASSRTCAS